MRARSHAGTFLGSLKGDRYLQMQASGLGWECEAQPVNLSKLEPRERPGQLGGRGETVLEVFKGINFDFPKRVSKRENVAVVDHNFRRKEK